MKLLYATERVRCLGGAYPGLVRRVGSFHLGVLMSGDPVKMGEAPVQKEGATLASFSRVVELTSQVEMKSIRCTPTIISDRSFCMVPRKTISFVDH